MMKSHSSYGKVLSFLQNLSSGTRTQMKGLIPNSLDSARECIFFMCIYMDVCVRVCYFFYYLLNLSLFLFGGNVEWPPGLISSREEEATTICLMDGMQDGSAYGQTNAKTFLFFLNFYLMRGRARLDVRRRRHWHRLLVRPSIRQSVIASYLYALRRPYCTISSLLSKWCVDQ